MASSVSFPGAKENILKGVDKAAALLLSLGEERAGKIFMLMDESEIRDISERMATLGTVQATTVEKVYEEFGSVMGTTGVGSLVGSYENTERLLMKVMDKDKAKSIMEEIRGPAGRTMWDKLGNVNEEVLANFLKNEYPQTVSVVLSKIKPEHAARVLAFLPEQFAVEVMNRMLRLEAIQRDVLDDVENTLRTEFMSNLARTAKRDAFEQMADIFNYFDRATENRFMTSLESVNNEAAEKIKALMFTFADLIKLDAAGIQTLMRVVDKSKLALAMKGANEELKDLFFANMSERAGKLMKEDMAAMGMVRLKDVDEAQSTIVNTAKDLAAKGEIIIAEGGEGEEMVG